MSNPVESTSVQEDPAHEARLLSHAPLSIGWVSRLRNLYPELLLIALFAFLVFWRLGHYHLWTDEAETALFAKSVLRDGVPTGFDGRNLIEIYGGMLLNPKLVNVWSPWLQYYLAAGSMALFGTGNFAARLPFAACGVAALVFAWLFARRYYNRQVALVALLLMATNVQFILFMRQCRYYGPIVLLMALFVWLYSRSEGRRPAPLLGAGLIYTFAFFTNPLVGAICLGSFLLAALLTGQDRAKTLRFAFIPAPAVLAVVAAYLLWVRRDGTPPDLVLFRNLHPRNFLRWFQLYLQDYNLVGLMPVGAVLVAVVLLAGAVAAKPWALRAWSWRRELLPLLTVLLATFLTGMLSIHPPVHGNSDLRYVLPVFPLLLILQASIYVRAMTIHRLLGYGLVALAVLTNGLSFQSPTSYLALYVQENSNPFPNAVRDGVELLEKAARQDDTVLVAPNYMLIPVYHYLSKKVLLCSAIPPDNKTVLPHQPGLPRHIYAQDFLPKWRIHFGRFIGEREEFLLQFLEGLPEDRYELVYAGSHGVDKSRPELFWRSFTPIRNFPPEHSLLLYRLKDEVTSGAASSARGPDTMTSETAAGQPASRPK